MRRTDRLYAVVEELRARAPRPVSRAALARRFEVTPRTVERDILALQEAGVPIWAQRGRGGGYSLDARWTLPPLNFEATEALAVIAALTAAGSMPFAAAGRHAQLKILAAMREDEAAVARQVASRLRMRRPAKAGREVIAVVERAIIERRVVVLAYEDRDGGVTAREVEAHGLHLSGSYAYLLGWCRLRDGGRAFRLDRITTATLTGEFAPERDVDSLADWIDDASTPDTLDGSAVEDLDEDERIAMTTTTKPARRSEPPRRADDTTGSDARYAAAIALGLPEVEESPHFDRPSFRVRGKVLMVLKPDDTAFIRCSKDEEVALAAAQPEAFESRDGLQVNLRRVGRDELRELIEGAWRIVAPKRSVAAFDKLEAEREPDPVTFDDIRELALSLPDVVEVVTSRGGPAFQLPGAKSKPFARFGPPIGNLLPPDDEDTLLVAVSSDQSRMLIESAPHRFFTTPHYEDHGWVMTRLRDNTRDDLEELGELLAEACESRRPAPARRR